MKKHLTLISCALLIGSVHAQSINWVSAGSAQAVAPLPPPAPQAFPETDSVSTESFPSIEAIQTQQGSRIDWGVRVGAITQRELSRIRRMQYQIEQQRYHAYADGWLTPDEQQSIFLALNNLSDKIEQSLFNVNATHYPQIQTVVAPPPLYIWIMPWWTVRPHHYGTHIRIAPQSAAFIQIRPNPAQQHTGTPHVTPHTPQNLNHPPNFAPPTSNGGHKPPRPAAVHRIEKPKPQHLEPKTQKAGVIQAFPKQ